MKKLLSLLFILTFLSAHAQYSEGIVYFKNGDMKNGLIKKNKFGSIKFKSERDSKAVKLNHKEIKGFENKDGEFIYKYANGVKSSKVLGFDSTSGKIIYEKSKNEPTVPILLKKIVKGDINLYADESSSMGFAIPGGGGATFGGGTSTIYYIEKGTSFVEIGSRIGENHLVYFNDCPILLEKIKDKTIQKNNLPRIVYFYNNECEEK